MAFIQRVQYHTKQNRVLIIFMLTYSVFPSVFVCFLIYTVSINMLMFLLYFYIPDKMGYQL